MLGGDHGKLKHGPPEGHSPVYECLLPKDKLLIKPCFHFGDPPKGILFGAAKVQEFIAFVPHPVDTSQVSKDWSRDFMNWPSDFVVDTRKCCRPYRKILET